MGEQIKKEIAVMKMVKQRHVVNLLEVRPLPRRAGLRAACAALGSPPRRLRCTRPALHSAGAALTLCYTRSVCLPHASRPCLCPCSCLSPVAGAAI